MDQQKLMLLVILFALVSHPKVYDIVEDQLENLGLGYDIVTEEGRPTDKGVLVHSVVFGVLASLVMSTKF